MRISDWSSDVCSSDLQRQRHAYEFRGFGGKLHVIHADPVPLEHGELGIVAAAGFPVAEHAAEFVAIAETGGEQALERILWSGAQPARARPRVGAAGEFERSPREVQLGVAGLRPDSSVEPDQAALGQELTQNSTCVAEGKKRTV